MIPVGYVLDYWVKAANESDAVAEHLRRQYRQRGARLMTRE